MAKGAGDHADEGPVPSHLYPSRGLTGLLGSGCWSPLTSILLLLCLPERFAPAPEKQQVSPGEKRAGLAAPSPARVGAPGGRAGGARRAGALQRPLLASGSRRPSPPPPYPARCGSSLRPARLLPAPPPLPHLPPCRRRRVMSDSLWTALSNFSMPSFPGGSMFRRTKR